MHVLQRRLRLRARRALPLLPRSKLLPALACKWTSWLVSLRRRKRRWQAPRPRRSSMLLTRQLLSSWRRSWAALAPHWRRNRLPAGRRLAR